MREMRSEWLCIGLVRRKAFMKNFLMGAAADDPEAAGLHAA